MCIATSMWKQDTHVQWALTDRFCQGFYKSVEVRKDHLYNKKPGGLAIGSEPRFIWVAMIKRPIVRHEKLSSIYALTRKFNDKLELAVKETIIATCYT